MSDGARPGRHVLAALIAIGLLSGSVPAASGAARAQAAGAEIPVAGSFRYPALFTDSQPEVIRGAVHAVRRIPGGTAVYYSVGVPVGMNWNPSQFLPVPGLDVDYNSADLAELALVETDGLRYYQPMVGPGGCLCPSVPDLGFDSGKLYVGWAVMAPLPPEVTSVSVFFGFGNQVEDVPVGDGALGPAVPMPTVLGTGWPCSAGRGCRRRRGGPLSLRAAPDSSCCGRGTPGGRRRATGPGGREPRG